MDLKKKLIKKNKGIIGMFLIFVFLSVILIFLFGFGIPMLIEFNTNMYNAGVDVINSTDISNLPQDAQDVINSAKDSVPQQINILSFFWKYSWVIVMLIVIFILFMKSRKEIEFEIRWGDEKKKM